MQDYREAYNEYPKADGECKSLISKSRVAEHLIKRYTNNLQIFNILWLDLTLPSVNSEAS